MLRFLLFLIATLFVVWCVLQIIFGAILLTFKLLFLVGIALGVILLVWLIQ